MKLIPTRKGYAVTEEGDVYSVKKEPKILHQRLSRTGYPVVNLFIDGKKYLVQVHTLVLEGFVGKRPIGTFASHLDGNRENSKLSNLVWEPQTVNLARRSEHGTTQEGSKNGKSKLTESAVYTIKTLLGVVSLEKIAKQFGVSVWAIQRIRDGETWNHVRVLVMPIEQAIHTVGNHVWKEEG